MAWEHQPDNLVWGASRGGAAPRNLSSMRERGSRLDVAATCSDCGGSGWQRLHR